MLSSSTAPLARGADHSLLPGGLGHLGFSSATSCGTLGSSFSSTWTGSCRTRSVGTDKFSIGTSVGGWRFWLRLEDTSSKVRVVLELSASVDAMDGGCIVGDVDSPESA
jgi:hypothetical protein